VQNEPANASAWYQIFKAQRYAFFGDTTATQKEKKAAMDLIIQSMQKNVPGSAEYHLAVWRNSGNDKSQYDHLEQAYTIAPDHPDIPSLMIAYHELEQNISRRDFFIKKMYDQKRDVPAALLEYGYNLLMSLEKNAVLFVSGDNDTYPLWILQVVKGIRRDVQIINTSLLSNPDYHNKLIKKLNLKGDESLFSGANGMFRDSDMGAYLHSVLRQQGSEIPFYFSLTVNPEILEPFKENLYLMGLAHKFSARHFDNLALLKRNFQKFRLDYLNMEFYNEEFNQASAWMNYFNMNYVAAMAMLYEHSMQSGQISEAISLRDIAINLGARAGQKKEIEDYFSEIDAKSLQSWQSKFNEPSQINENSFSVYPNPASSVINIENTLSVQADIIITDLRGYAVYQGRMQQQSLTIPATEFKNGTYSVQFFTEKGVFSKTLIIAR
jgi:hypothetical protein